MKRCLLTLCVFLLLGAIVNVAVAIGLWNWGQRPAYGSFDAIDAWGRRPSTNIDLDVWHQFASPDWPDPLLGCMYQTFFGMRFSRLVAAKNLFDPRNASGEEWLEKARNRTFYSIEIVESGWPLPVARVAEAQVTAGMPPTITKWDDAWQLGRRRIPRTVLWPGFAINTLFYAAIVWGLFAAPFALRRRRRIKRGLCPKCAYPIGTSDVCTECGAAVRYRLTGGADR